MAVWGRPECPLSSGDSGPVEKPMGAGDVSIDPRPAAARQGRRKPVRDGLTAENAENRRGARMGWFGRNNATTHAQPRYLLITPTTKQISIWITRFGPS